MLVALVGCSGTSREPPFFLASEWTVPRYFVFGLSWQARDSVRLTGAGPSTWSASAEALAVDSEGALRLRLVRCGERWCGAEISAPVPDRYGVLEVETELAAPLPPDAVAGIFLYRTDRSELDIELGRWRDPRRADAQYVVAPAERWRSWRFELGAVRSRHRIAWSSDEVAFSTCVGSELVAAWRFRGGDRPRPGGHRVHLNLWRRDAWARDAGAELRVWQVRFSPGAPAPTGCR